MSNQIRELSIDELGRVSGGDDFGMGAALQIASVTLEAGGNATVSSKPAIRQSGAPQIDPHATALATRISDRCGR